MVIPSAMNVESALDGLRRLSAEIQEDQRKELHSAVGGGVAANLGVAYPLTSEFNAGYQLGLQTARVMIHGSTEVRLNKVNPEHVL